MDTWILFAIVSGTLFGLAHFISKISATNKFNKDRFIFFGNAFFLLYSGIYFIYDYKYVHVSIILLFLIALRIIAALEKNLFIIESLKYIESSLFFPFHKIINIFASFLIGMIFFSEYLSIIEIFAVFLGILMIILLSGNENKKVQIDYKKGLFFLFLSNFVLLFSSSINKYISSINFDKPTYLFYSSLIGCIYLALTKKQIYKKYSKKELKNELFLGGLRSAFGFFGFILLLKALKDGPFVLVGMINSTTIFVPIILSIIFYKEKITLSKLLAFIIFVIIIILLAIA